MSNDDSRGNESPDRQDDAQPTTYRPILEQIDTQATELLETITDDPTLEPMPRLKAKRHCRELRAEIEYLRRHLLDQDERRVTVDKRAGGIERVSGPVEALHEASRRDDGETGHERDDTTETEDELDD